MSKYLVVTSCTNRKRGGECAPATPSLGRARSVEEFADAWITSVRNKKKKFNCRDLYGGRSFTEAVSVADTLGAPLFVVSAGLGLVKDADSIPNYDATLSSDKSRLSKILDRLDCSADKWWRVLGKANGVTYPISSLVRRTKVEKVFLALPSAYIQLAIEDLKRIDGKHVDRVRFFTSPLGAKLIPGNLVSAVLPYDDRLQGSSLAGTRTDFAQRAMRHFVIELNGKDLSLEDARKVVQKSMKSLRTPKLPKRVRKSDEELLALIRKNWKRCDGSSGRLLRYLRDEAKVSCEQSRFRLLWLSVRPEA